MAFHSGNRIEDTQVEKNRGRDLANWIRCLSLRLECLGSAGFYEPLWSWLPKTFVSGAMQSPPSPSGLGPQPFENAGVRS